MKLGIYKIRGEGRKLGGCCHPPGEVSLERRLIVIARLLRLARNLHHDVPTVIGREELRRSIDEAFDSRLPFCLRVTSALNPISASSWIQSYRNL